MNSGRHARGVAVPIEQIKRHRVFAQQIIIDDARPDQIIGTQQIKRIGHAAAGQIAFAFHAAFNPFHLFIVYINAQIAGLFKIHLGCEKGGRPYAVVALGGHIAQGSGH